MDQLGKWADVVVQHHLAAARWVVGLLLGVLALLALEAMLSSTSLITPIGGTLLAIMWAIGLVLGLLLAIITAAAQRMGLAKTALLLLGMPLMVGFGSAQLAWRIADWIEFGFSSAEFRPALYPIVSASIGRRKERPSLAIDPYGVRGVIKIPVPAAQFHAIDYEYRGYCIMVMQRVSPSGAVEILNDGVFTFREPEPTIIATCPQRQTLGPGP